MRRSCDVRFTDVVMARQLSQGTLLTTESAERIDGTELTAIAEQGKQKGDADCNPAQHQYEQRFRHHFFSPPRLVGLGEKIVVSLEKRVDAHPSWSPHSSLSLSAQRPERRS